MVLLGVKDTRPKTLPKTARKERKERKKNIIKKRGGGGEMTDLNCRSKEPNSSDSERT